MFEWPRIKPNNGAFVTADQGEWFFTDLHSARMFAQANSGLVVRLPHSDGNGWISERSPHLTNMKITEVKQ